MSVEFDRRQLELSAPAQPRSAGACREDAEIAISMLGRRAQLKVQTATTLHFGQWLNWPDWLRHGTSLACDGPLPRTVSLADDLIIIGISLAPPWPMGPLFQFSALTALALVYRAVEALSFADPAEMVLETRICCDPAAQAMLAGFACRKMQSDEAERLRFPSRWQSIQ